MDQTMPQQIPIKQLWDRDNGMNSIRSYINMELCEKDKGTDNVIISIYFVFYPSKS
jgi:hypothetical protein